MPNWITKNISTIIALISLGGSAFVYVSSNSRSNGVADTKTEARLALAEVKIEKLENQQADKTRWMVEQHEKAIIEQREELRRLKEELNTKLDKMAILLARIDQRTGGGK